MAEPTTAITDFLMAAVALVLAVRIAGAWRFAFLFTAIAALTGGLYHSSPSVALWKITVYSIGLGTFFLIWAAAYGKIIASAFAVIELVVYCIWMATHDDFIYVIADYGSGMIVVAILYAMRYRANPRASKLVLASIAVAVAGAAVQASGFSLHRNFNHNDLYHIIQIVSLVLLYRGACASTMSLSTAPPSV